MVQLQNMENNVDTCYYNHKTFPVVVVSGDIPPLSDYLCLAKTNFLCLYPGKVELKLVADLMITCQLGPQELYYL